MKTFFIAEENLSKHKSKTFKNYSLQTKIITTTKIILEKRICYQAAYYFQPQTNIIGRPEKIIHSDYELPTTIFFKPTVTLFLVYSLTTCPNKTFFSLQLQTVYVFTSPKFRLIYYAGRSQYHYTVDLNRKIYTRTYISIYIYSMHKTRYKQEYNRKNVECLFNVILQSSHKDLLTAKKKNIEKVYFFIYFQPSLSFKMFFVQNDISVKYV